MIETVTNSIKTYVNSQVLNQETTTELALATFLAGGYILLTGPTGLGKTHWATAFLNTLGPNYKQIQLTEDTQYRDEKRHEDFVIAIHDGSFALPPMISDRFMMKLQVNYPGVAAEKQILQMHHLGTATNYTSAPICGPDAIAQAKYEVQAVAVEDSIFNYIISIVETTRRVNAVQTGASIRGSIDLLLASKAYAAVKGQDYVSMDDVRSLAMPVLCHRITLKPDAVREGIQAERIIESILVGRRY